MHKVKILEDIMVPGTTKTAGVPYQGDPWKAGMTERWNHGMAESRNGGKSPQILKDGIAESRNGGKYPQILKDGMAENHPKS